MSEVLVVGAGPTGLALAAQLAAHGADARVIERRTRPQESRAYVVQPRTLEVLAPLGLADELIDRGDPSAEGRIHAGGRTATGTIATGSGTDSPYPFLLSIPQATVEDVLEQHLRTVGVDVEHGVSLEALEQRADAVVCRLQGPDGQRRCSARYVVGCDGATSTVRPQAGIGFPASTYRPALVLADLQVSGLEPGVFHVFVGAPGLLFLFPSPSGPGWRLLAVRSRQGPEPDLATLQQLADRFTGGDLQLGAPTWSRQLRLRRGQATTYRRGRILLAGDAAHVNSPAAAQGMNTGIQDAANLGWKLAAVATGAAGQGLLDSYEAERWPVARRVRQLTDLAFLGEAGDLPPLRWGRRYLAPLVLPLVDGRRLPGVVFRLIGGLAIDHRGSPIVADGEPAPGRGPRAGDRLPDTVALIDHLQTTLHAALRPPGHHLLWFGTLDTATARRLAEVARSAPVPLHTHHVQGPSRLLRRFGAQPTAHYLVRPDGYLAYRARGLDVATAVEHLRCVELR